MDEMNPTNNITPTVCPDCGTVLPIPEDVEVGDVVVCTNEECGVELEIVNTNPVEVDYLMIQK